jgi:hypothetical protein
VRVAVVAGAKNLNPHDLVVILTTLSFSSRKQHSYLDMRSLRICAGELPKYHGAVERRIQFEDVTADLPRFIDESTTPAGSTRRSAT